MTDKAQQCPVGGQHVWKTSEYNERITWCEKCGQRKPPEAVAVDRAAAARMERGEKGINE